MRKTLWALAAVFAVFLGLSVALATLAYQAPPPSPTPPPALPNQPQVFQVPSTAEIPAGTLPPNSSYVPPQPYATVPPQPYATAPGQVIYPSNSYSYGPTPAFPPPFSPSGGHKFTITTSDGKGGFETVYLDRPLTPEENKESTETITLLQNAIQDFKNPKVDSAKREEARTTIKKYLESVFDHDQSKRRKQVEELETRITELKGQLEKRDEAKERLIETRIMLLEDEREGLGFPNAFLSLPGTYPRQNYDSPYATYAPASVNSPVRASLHQLSPPTASMPTTSIPRLPTLSSSNSIKQEVESKRDRFGPPGRRGFSNEATIDLATIPPDYRGRWVVRGVTHGTQPLHSATNLVCEISKSSMNISWQSPLPPSIWKEEKMDGSYTFNAGSALPDSTSPIEVYFDREGREEGKEESVTCFMELDGNHLVVQLSEDTGTNRKVAEFIYTMQREQSVALEKP